MFASLVLGAFLSAAAPTAAAADTQHADVAATASTPGLLATPQFRHYGQADGIPSGAVYAIAQDHDGILWFGSAEGLVRYDGVNFKVFRHSPDDPDSLPADQTYALYVDRGNRLWMGGVTSGLISYDQRTHRFHEWTHDAKKADSLANDEVWSIAQTPDGALWVATQSGLDRLRPDFDSFDHIALPVSGSTDGMAVRVLLADADGRLWIGGNNGLFVREADGNIHAVPMAPGFHEDLHKVWHIQGIPGDIRVSTSTGLLVIGKDGVARPLADSRLAALDASITSSVRDAQGRLWMVGTKGILFDDGHGGLQHITSHPLLPGGLPDDRIWQVLRDREGGLWFALDKSGLAYLPPAWGSFARFTHVPDDPDSLSGVSAMSVQTARDGRLLVGGFDGWIDALDVAHGTVEHLSHDLRGDILAMAQDAKGRIWVTESGAVFRLDNGKVTQLDIAKAHVSRPVFMQAPGDGKIYVASWSEGLYAIDPDSLVISPVPTPAGVPDTAIADQLVSHDGTLWYASGGGLLRLDEGSGRMVSVPGMPQQEVLAVDFDASGFWTATQEHLTHYRYASGVATSDQSIDISHQPFLANLMAIRADPQGNVWIFANPGLWRMDARTHRFTSFAAAQGLSNAEFPGGSTAWLPDGSLLAASNGGVVGFRPGGLPQQVQGKTPQLILSQLTVNRGGSIRFLDTTPGKTLRLGWRDRDLHVQTRLVSYVDPSANRYRYRLHGFDSSWVDVDNRGEREFAGLRAGSYTLDVMAAGASGTWTQLPSPLHIEVQAPPWQRWWAWLLYVAVLAAVAGWILRAWRRRLAERHRIELIEQRHAMAEQASEAKTRFLATLSHEIRTPMTGVMGMAELLLNTPLDERQRDYARAMQHSGGVLLKLLNDTLDLVRIEAGRMELEQAPYDPRQLVHEVAQLEQGLAWSKGLRFVVEMADDLPALAVGDAVRIKQILLNLVGNALKFTLLGSITLRASCDAGQLVFSVTDTGPGIPEGSRARLFQRFEQEDSPQRSSGTGLGLSICRELVEMMGGSIELQSQLGHGSTFLVRLPLIEAEHANDGRTPPLPGHRRNLNLLLVEDDPTVATVIVGLLQQQGHTIHHAVNGLLALAELDRGHYDAMLLDLDLPGVDGFQLSRLIRRRETDRRLPIVAVTARTSATDETQAREAGMDGFLRKPLTGEQLMAALASVVEGEGETVE
ncbi:hybrid sensor histidine kinase/response regulator [Rhodanobacter sp. DHG33]|uniref:hybrid sensor histidine kinase/response regulator n=1 Tax=Rhodanobacter sp. DHG33 TaxID=2775921 RepID=UPI00177C743C|nr:hybrid sensor histidine kinase/response regulator [Rhodanobacter sp. DHG33]MBD8897723.1 response regulator [Rhodanobacter sp. DHG33]